MDRCAGCGYFADAHESGKCPVCVCGDTPAQHESVGDERRCACGCEVASAMHIPLGRRCPLCDESVPHACVWATWLGHPCPGRRSTSEAGAGKWLVVRQGKYKPPAEPGPARTWFGLTVPDLAPTGEDAARPCSPDVAPPPLVRARAPQSPGEFAGYQGKQAVGLGRAAAAAGWNVEAAYWMAGDGTEGCAVRVARGPDRAVATWARPAGLAGRPTGWKTDVAYAWRLGSGVFPMKLTHTRLEELLA